MGRYWKIKIVGLTLFVAILISFPFFKIKFFETHSSFRIIYHHFLIPVSIISLFRATLLYIKYLRKLNTPTNSKIKVAVQDIVTMTFLTFIFIVILCSLTLSTIVTTNAYLEPQKEIIISEAVIKYEADTTKWGRLRHYIDFKNPIDNRIIRLEVYKKYAVGEIFTKEMKIGKWGQLYSMQ